MAEVPRSTPTEIGFSELCAHIPRILASLSLSKDVVNHPILTYFFELLYLADTPQLGRIFTDSPIMEGVRWGRPGDGKRVYFGLIQLWASNDLSYCGIQRGKI